MLSQPMAWQLGNLFPWSGTSLLLLWTHLPCNMWPLNTQPAKTCGPIYDRPHPDLDCHNMLKVPGGKPWTTKTSNYQKNYFQGRGVKWQFRNPDPDSRLYFYYKCITCQSYLHFPPFLHMLMFFSGLQKGPYWHSDPKKPGKQWHLYWLKSASDQQLPEKFKCLFIFLGVNSTFKRVGGNIACNYTTLWGQGESLRVICHLDNASCPGATERILSKRCFSFEKQNNKKKQCTFVRHIKSE